MTGLRDSGSILVLMRHGESVSNRSLRLTGWADVPLSARGRAQARQAGIDLRARGFVPDICYCSELRRASETRDILLAAHGAEPALRQSWRLNERHYGAMQDLSIWRAAWRFGPAALLRCGRDAAARPPLLAAPATSAPPGVAPADAEEWRRAQRGESIADAVLRLLPLWEAEIAPSLRAGNGVLVVAHNNLLRGLLRHLERADGPLPHRLATARPLIIELDAELRIARLHTDAAQPP